MDIQSSFSRLPEFVYFFTSKFRQTTCPAVVHSLSQSSKKIKRKVKTNNNNFKGIEVKTNNNNFKGIEVKDTGEGD
ncbi:hypothetical protein [Bacillus halotolerans]|uniref:hypothetical protein n=1 Tax=Bacillus halotolerans TaxID=260554 RepID=UPI00398F6532